MIFSKVIDLTYKLTHLHKSNIRCKHFTFIFYKGKLVSVGVNNPKKTHPYNLKFSYKDRQNNNISEYIGIHSELSAVLRYGAENCNNHVLINTRLNAKKELANSRPCHGCQSLIKQLNFKKIYYTTDTGEFKQL